MRLVEKEEAARLLPPVYDVVRAATPGFLARSPDWWAKEVLADPEFARRGHDRKFFAVHERAGKPVAYVIYRVKLEWGDVGSQSQLTIQELIGGRRRRSARDVALRLRGRPDRSHQEPLRAAG